MSAIVIRRPTLASHFAELREIFFESSTRKVFKDVAEKETFFWKYTGFYLKHYPDFVFVATLGEKVLGYCLGMPRTHGSELFVLQPHLKIFQDLFEDYPAHLHINCHADSRGLGIGAKLLTRFEDQLQAIDIAGVHLITGADARNRSFYARQGYTFEVPRVYEGKTLLFLGKKLTVN